MSMVYRREPPFEVLVVGRKRPCHRSRRTEQVCTRESQCSGRFDPSNPLRAERRSRRSSGTSTTHAGTAGPASHRSTCCSGADDRRRPRQGEAGREFVDLVVGGQPAAGVRDGGRRQCVRDGHSDPGIDDLVAGRAGRRPGVLAGRANDPDLPRSGCRAACCVRLAGRAAVRAQVRLAFAEGTHRWKRKVSGNGNDQLGRRLAVQHRSFRHRRVDRDHSRSVGRRRIPDGVGTGVRRMTGGRTARAVEPLVSPNPRSE